MSQGSRHLPHSETTIERNTIKIEYTEMKVGIIGAGLLGSAIAKRLASKNHDVSIYNRTPDKVAALSSLGIKRSESPRELAKISDVVLIIVKDAGAVEQVSFGKNGIIEGKHDGLVVADITTQSPISSKKISKRYQEEQIPMIDSPVMGGPRLAENGELVVMVGGKKEHYDICKPVLDDIGEKTFYLGPSGSGEAMKLAMNLQISILAIAISEGIILAKRSGLDPLLFLDVLNSTYFKTGMSINKGPKMAKGVFEPSFYLEMMQKDLREINYTAKEFGANLPAAKLADELYQKAIKQGFGKLDYTGILAYIDELKF